MYHLYKLFYKGVHERYDKKGNTIPGVEPDHRKAINYMEKVVTSEYGTTDDLIKLAKIYHLGMHKFEPDLKKAKGIYTYIVKNCPTVTNPLTDEVTLRETNEYIFAKDN